MDSTPYEFIELDEETRSLMHEELVLDVESDSGLYASKVLTTVGLRDYPALLEQALLREDEAWLAARLNEGDRLEASPIAAAERLSRTEFNRYYIRAICRRAALHGVTVVVPYRAHYSEDQRSDSAGLEHSPQSAPRILANLRARAANGDPESKLGRVNSGMSARCGCADCLGPVS
jgi:hypothetical protein